MLSELLEHVIAHGKLTKARIPPMRTAVKQYAHILGYDPSRCPPEAYHLPDNRRRMLINEKAPEHIGDRTLTNLKNNISFLLRTAVALKLLPKLDTSLKDWNERTVEANWNPDRRDEGGKPLICHFAPLTPRLEEEFTAFAEWCTKDYSPDRPAKIRKREVTLRGYREDLQRILYYLTELEHQNPTAFGLQDLVNPDAVKRYVAWWVTKRGKITSTIDRALRQFIVISRHWLRDPSAAAAITQLKGSLGAADTVYNKSQRWLPLETLDAIGRSRYPFNLERLRTNPSARRLHIISTKDPQALIGLTITDRGKRYYRYTETAFHVEMSLLIRFLTWIPLRSRNIREMQLGRNLQQVHDGMWRVHFEGRELKIGRRRGRDNILDLEFPVELYDLLAEWLTIWRPILLRGGTSPFVFLSFMGKPFTSRLLNMALSRTTWKFSGVAVNTHMFRDIWATAYLTGGGRVEFAAKILGNTEAVIYRHYAHILERDAQQEAFAWRRRLGETD